MKYKVLVIDDEIKRHSQYVTILGNYFDLDFIINPSQDFNKLIDKSFDAYIIDVVLPSAWSNCVGELDKVKPTIIVSSKWEDAKIHLNAFTDFNIVHFFGWDEFQTNTIATTINDETGIPSINNKILFTLNKHYSLSSLKKEENDSIKILHISDLQFGDPSYNDDSFLNQDIISNKLNELGIDIDLIVITGDIAFSGLPSEYNDASKWLHKLSVNLFDFTNYNKNILFVPGNHDTTFDISIINKWKFNGKLFNPENIVDKEVELRENEIDDFDLLKFAPYRTFGYSLTRDERFLQENLSYINDSFASWGLRFIHINTCESTDYKDIWGYKLKDSTLEMLNDQKNSFDKHDLFSIVLCHHGPEHLGYNIGGHKKEWLHLKNFLSLKNTKLFLHGHTHGEFNSRKISLDDKEMDCIQTGTLNLKKLANPDDSRNFLVIELKRINGKVNNLELIPFEIRKNRVNKLDSINL